MIPIRYVGDMSAYDRFIQSLKEKLKVWIDQGYGYDKRETKSKSAILSHHDSLPIETRELFLRAVEDGFADRESLAADSSTELCAPKSMFSVDGLNILKRLYSDFDHLTNASAEELPKIIEKLERDFPALAERKTEVIEDLKLVFVDHGYKKLDKDSLWRASDVRVCPYCNRTYVGVVKTKKRVDGETKIVKGQLDHFYPKESYPYLAVSKHNLVPSCTYCNGYAGKWKYDSYRDGLVNPFALSDHKGLRFNIGGDPSLLLDLKEFVDKGKIGVNFPGNPEMAKNCEVFNLECLYNSHRDIAAETIFKHRAMSSRSYVDFVKGLVNDPALHIDAKDFGLLYWGVPLEEDRLSERPMSKFILDLLNDLSNH